MTPDCGPKITRGEAIKLFTERRERGMNPLLALALLTIPAFLVSVVMPRVWPGEIESWFVIGVDVILIGIFVIWRAAVALGKMFSGLRARSNIARMEAGDRLLHWRYTDAEWERFAAQEYTRDRCLSRRFTSFRQGFFASAIFGVFVFGMLTVVRINETNSSGKSPYPPEVLFFTTLAALILPLAVTAVQLLNMYLNDRAAARARRDVPEISLNQYGVEGLPGGYLFLPPGETVFGIEDGEVPVLRVVYRRYLRTQVGRFPVKKVERIPIPRGREAEAQALAGRGSHS